MSPSHPLPEWLVEISPEALVAWDRDVPDSFIPLNWCPDDNGIFTVYSHTCFWYEFVCDPVPHWRSHDDALYFEGWDSSLRSRRLHRL